MKAVIRLPLSPPRFTMTSRRFTPANPAELRERGVRLFRENRADYASDTAAYKAIAPKLGCSPDSLRVWCQQAERDNGQRTGLTSAEKDRIKELYPVNLSSLAR
ncbi:hypothetical protein [Aestuariicoccus sp. MJ-SS9]|uniref:hypothetical protein n=1 Tax=Aestuariicoccus sp. MJ-SS9 TaxID=3079855 RepID=UPI0029119563|nr:hypothetical protein [Aestuariicoccus sp. MJ-SS9]MDU8914166.1 hypothetical protein [Aestuariicoccus sp. MJ-SS9]